MRLPPNLSSAAIILAAALLVWFVSFRPFPVPPHLHEPQPDPQPQLALPTEVHSASAARPCPISAWPRLRVPDRSGAVFARASAPDPCDYDKDIAWFRAPPQLTTYENDIYLYFGKRGDFTELMLFTQRLKQDGDEVTRIVAELDARAVTLLHPTCMFTEVVRRHDHTPAGAPREAVTFGLISPEDVAAVRELANANRVVLRFVGRLAMQEWEVPPEQLGRMREVIKDYEGLTRRPWDELQMEERACR